MKTWKDDLGKRFVFQTPRRYAATFCACTVFFVRRVVRILTEPADTFCLSLKLSPFFLGLALHACE